MLSSWTIENRGSWWRDPNNLLVSKSVFLELLKDEVFVDYLNKFLTLPVFGQRSIYVLKTDEFIFEPKLTAEVNTNYESIKARYKEAVIDWLLEKRLPFFFRSLIYAEYKVSFTVSGKNKVLVIACESSDRIWFGRWWRCWRSLLVWIAWKASILFLCKNVPLLKLFGVHVQNSRRTQPGQLLPCCAASCSCRWTKSWWLGSYDERDSWSILWPRKFPMPSICSFRWHSWNFQQVESRPLLWQLCLASNTACWFARRFCPECVATGCLGSCSIAVNKWTAMNSPLEQTKLIGRLFLMPRLES